MHSSTATYSTGPGDEIMPGVQLGEAAQVFTPAFWKMVSGERFPEARPAYKLGSSLKEEVVACLLGGHGIVGEVGVAAFEHLRKSGLLDKQSPSIGELAQVLSEPLFVNRKRVHYRYPYQKARYIAGAIERLANFSAERLGSGRILRDWLTKIPGVGYKTASWIARNWLDADDVAILDIHIHRAGVLAGFYKPNDDVARQYLQMEASFLRFSEFLDVRASVLDSLMWNELRMAPTIVRQLLEMKGVAPGDRCGLPPAKHRSASSNYLLFAGAGQ